MIILNDQQVEVPGLNSINWLSHPTECPRTPDFGPRRAWIRAVVVHTVKGIRGALKPGGKSTGRHKSYSKYQANTPRQVSWDYTIDMDGAVAASNDPVKSYTWHAGAVNAHTIGIELVQEDDGSTYEEQYTKGLLPLVNFLTSYFGIQRQVPWHNNEPDSRVLTRLTSPLDGRDLIGVYGHRNQTRNRGFGDPGNHAFVFFKDAGYATFDFEKEDDKNIWEARQRALGMSQNEADGVPGPKTVSRLKAEGYTDGLWAERP